MTRTRCDTGPLIAIVDPAHANDHARCMKELENLQGTLVTTWVCLAEAMHLAYGIGGRPFQRALWKLLANPVFEIEPLTKEHGQRMDQMMERYQNVPMDLADASLYVCAEIRSTRRVFTLDNDFRIYRFDDGGYFEVIPA